MPFFKHIALFIGVMVLTIVAGVKPNYNWDCLPYAAIVLHMDSDLNAKELHKKVYSEAEKTIPSKQFKLLTSSTSFKSNMATNYEGFTQQLDFYTIKPLYISLVWLGYKMRFSAIYATVFPSLLAFAGIAILFFLWIKPSLNHIPATIATIILLLMMPFSGIARESSPDALSCFFLMLTCYWFYTKKCWMWIASALLFAILSRPDNLVFGGVLCILLLATKHWRLLDIFCLGMTCFLAYITPKLLLHSYSWSTLFYHSFVEQINNPATTEVILSSKQYFATVFRNAFREVKQSLIPLILVIGIPLWKNYRPTLQANKILWLTLFFCVSCRYFLFPVLTGRFMAPYYLTAIALILIAYSTHNNKQTNETN